MPNFFIFLIYFAPRQVADEITLEITYSGIGVPWWGCTIGVPVWSVLIVLRIFQEAYRVSRKSV